MKLLDLFKVKKTPEAPVLSNQKESSNHLVIIQFFYGIEDLSELNHLENELRLRLIESEIGSYNGHEISLDFGDGYLFFIGEDSEQIYECVKPILENYYFMDKSIATLRTGTFEQENAQEKDFVLRFSKLAKN
ncbi:hypothetical protein [Fluviicola taffensis]|uniref:Uncharacterized protein n=1 Tax=Fluviicola taffensis (strain DSM 16823 / NCIMB 13979 / RW262) TaxID=755732 RepID=F2IHV5_FLUTR|nr:hypothetical protein [Fluviicola taffensis]AEA45914.1 hypothetical protein Fluta_3950 [Fluviicola taffensis DSM 16823]